MGINFRIIRLVIMIGGINLDFKGHLSPGMKRD